MRIETLNIKLRVGMMAGQITDINGIPAKDKHASALFDAYRRVLENELALQDIDAEWKMRRLEHLRQRHAEMAEALDLTLLK